MNTIQVRNVDFYTFSSVKTVRVISFVTLLTIYEISRLQYLKGGNRAIS